MTAPNEPPTRYLSVHELAARWGEHPNTVYARVRTPEWLDAVEDSGGFRTPVPDESVHLFRAISYTPTGGS